MAAKKKGTRAAKPRRAGAKKSARAAERKKHGKRADHGTSVEPFIERLRGETREIAERLRALVQREVPGVSESIKWGMPVYEHHGLLCYIAPRPKYVSFGFYKDAGYDDPDELLEGSGLGGHVKIARAAAIPEAQIALWLKQAVAFNVARAG